METYNEETFPKPDCPSGYSWSFLEEILDEETFEQFGKWMSGQTMTLCEGRRYDHEAKEYRADECAGNPHGGVAYQYDLHRFLGFLGRYHQNLWD